MSFDINKPFTRRDGKEVLWWKILEGTYNGLPWNKVVYAIETADGNHILQKVDAATGLEYTPESMRESDLINTPEYEWANVYLNNLGSFRKSKHVADSIYNEYQRRGYLRRPKGSTDITEWELLPLDTEIE